METKKHQIRYCSYSDLLERNQNRPETIRKIKNNILETLSILMNGFGITGIAHYCLLTSKKTISKSTYYDYLHLIEPILRTLAENSCDQKFNQIKNNIIIKIGFDASWGHRRNADNCLGILMDLDSGTIIGFHIVHHGKVSNRTTTATNKHAKCMESISLFNIIQDLKLSQYNNIKFIHDCDLTGETIIQEHIPNAIIKFDPNHYSKKIKKTINQFCSKYEDLKDLSQRIESFYSILIHDKNTSIEDKQLKWLSVPDHFIQSEDLDSKFNEETIKKLRKFLKDTIYTFNEVDPELSTNPIESFNFTRALLANKNIAYRISWRIRAYIAILKWNSPFWESDILNAFSIKIPEEVIIFQEKKQREKEKIRINMKSDDSRKKRSTKRKIKLSKYKTTTKDTCLHKDKNDIEFLSLNVNINDFSGLQKKILVAIKASTTEDKPYITFNSILKYIFEYNDDLNKPDIYKKIKTSIKSQLTKMTNKGILRQKKLSYKLEIKLELQISR